MAFGVKDLMNGAKSVAGNNLFQGGLGNYSEMDKEAIQKEYGMYLMDGEEITVGFKLVRDALIFTDKRIIFTDKQGATGSKMRIESITFFQSLMLQWKLPDSVSMIVNLPSHISKLQI